MEVGPFSRTSTKKPSMWNEKCEYKSYKYLTTHLKVLIREMFVYFYISESFTNTPNYWVIKFNSIYQWMWKSSVYFWTNKIVYDYKKTSINSVLLGPLEWFFAKCPSAVECHDGSQVFKLLILLSWNLVIKNEINMKLKQK